MKVHWQVTRDKWIKEIWPLPFRAILPHLGWRVHAVAAPAL
jgi:hypothetical protein